MGRPAADANIFAAIAHPTRRAVLDQLRAGEHNATELRAVLSRRAAGASQPAFSEHLSVLARSGLVRTRRQGRQRVYSLRAAPLAEAFDWLKAYEGFWDERLERLGTYLDRKGKPQP